MGLPLTSSQEAGGAAAEVEGARLVAVGVGVAADVAVLEPDLERVGAPDPGDQVVDDVGRPRRDVADVEARRCPTSRSRR